MLLSKASSVCCFQVNASLSLTSNCTGANQTGILEAGLSQHHLLEYCQIILEELHLNHD